MCSHLKTELLLESFMFKQLKNSLKEIFRNEPLDKVEPNATLHTAMAGLLCEVSNADQLTDENEKKAILHLLSALLEIPQTEALTLFTHALENIKHATSLFEYTDRLRQLSPPQRLNLIESMWEVAYADGKLDPIEESIIRRTADLLYVDHALLMKSKHLAQTSMPTSSMQKPSNNKEA